MESILPLELIELVIDQLGFQIVSNLGSHPTGRQTLQNCALASRSFRSRATHWLFFRASLEGKKGDETWMQKRLDIFLQILVANPFIGGSIRELLIITAPDDFKIWLQDNATLISVLGKLSQVQRFYLRHRHKAISWETLPPKTATALESIIQIPSLRKLELHAIHDFPWSMLNGCGKLKDLSLVRVRTSHKHFTAVHAPTTTIAPTLVSASIFSARSTTEFLLANPMTAKMLSQLRTLSLGLHHSVEREAAVNLIIKVAQTLEYLNIIGMKDQLINDDDPLYKINVSRVPFLRHLDILRCVVRIGPGELPRFPSSLLQLLNLRGSTSDIQTMAINIQYRDVEMGTERQLLQLDHGWADFDVILADENYRALKKITLTLGIEFVWWDPTTMLTDDGIKPLVARLFPAVNASGRVKMVILVNLF